jgi:hypothetical protein
VIGVVDRLWHRHVKGHFIVFHPALKPDSVIRDKQGRPAINVFEQATFQRPDAHYECNCGKEWRARR